MCGILGYWNVSNSNQRLTNLLLESEARGKDATGLAYFRKNKDKKMRVHYIKQAVEASEFIKNKYYKKFLTQKSPKVLIGHTRAKTQGPVTNMDNNHPIVSADGIALVHNGIITNDAALFEEYSLVREAEVDSEIILKLICMFRKKYNMVESIQKTISLVRGSLAIAVIDIAEPDVLYLAKTSNPIYMGFEKSTNNIYFASSEIYLKRPFMDYLIHRNFFFEQIENDLVIHEIPTDSGVRITKDQISTFKLTTPAYVAPATSYKSSYTDYNTSAADDWRAKKYKGKKKDIRVDGVDDFDVNQRIVRPSKYSDVQLEDRREEVETLLCEMKVDESAEAENEEWIKMNQLEIELKRIEDTLQARYMGDDFEEGIRNPDTDYPLHSSTNPQLNLPSGEDRQLKNL